MITLKRMTPDNAFRFWGTLLEGVEKVVSSGDSSLTSEKVFNRLLEGQYVCWVVFSDNAYIGFAITRFYQEPLGEPEMHIIQAYLKPGSPEDAFFIATDYLKQVAKGMGIKYIKFWTKREKAFEVRMKRYKITPSSTEYLMEV